ncbi:MAG: hypothetical protein JXJ20_09465 [Anaerolineae bacterium]|jgi:hypothetical protein|nr:hypothetical protein [Anaerolineae bacterium]
MRKKLFRYRTPSAKTVTAKKRIKKATRPARALLSIVYLAFLAAVLLGISPIATAQDQTSDVSFKTPEEAITFYMQAVVQGDVAKIMQACAIDEMSEKFRFDLYANRLQALTLQAPAPSDYPFYAEINKAQFSWQVLNQARNLAYGLLSTEQELIDGYTVPIDTEGAIQFMKEVDPERLAQLQVTKIGVPYPEIASDERNLNNWNKQAQIYGADELTERVVLLLFEGDYYYVGFTLLRYGEDWKISSAASQLGYTNAVGAPQETTEEEFLELVGGS